MLDLIAAPARRTRALLATALVALASLPAVPALAQAAAPDYSGWQDLLNRYVVRIAGAKGETADTRFDYEQLYVDDGIWGKRASARLQAVRAQLLAVSPSAMDERTRLAWALNTCNFLVVERATLHLLVPMRQFQRYQTVEQMQTLEGSFFDGQIAEVDGRKWSIAEFERRFVYGDTTPVIEQRTRAADPRLFFALCRGSVGGPSLPARAFRPESLEAQLDQVTRAALARPAMARWDAASRSLLVSNLLAQRQLDFGGPSTGIVRFLEKYGPAPLRSAIRREKLSDVTRFTPADPALNQFERPKPKPPTASPEPKS